ncbi:MAG TPA: BON domain-containing protein [Rhodocyclaceae bacterium]|nr:BON domain-containing protein [Rhodocyclaceae bacterium]
MKKIILAALLSSLTLSACVPAVMFGGAVAGAYAASDRRSVEQQIEDKRLDNLIERRIEENFGETIHVNATAFNGVVLLTGEIPTAELRASFQQLIQLTPNVKRFIDETKQIPLSSTQWRLNDAAMTTKVKSRLANTDAFHISHIKVVTEGNDVYLMGRVSQKEADAAIAIARTTQAVNRVVNAFEIMTEEEWQKEVASKAAARANPPERAEAPKK